MLTARHDWVRLFEGETARDVIPVLADILQTRRWFGGKARRIKEVRILDCIPIPADSTQTLLLIRVEYGDAGTETYTLPVTAAFGEEAERIRRDFPTAVIAPLVLQRDGSEHTGLLYDALWNRDLALALLNAIGQERRFRGIAGCMTASSTSAFTELVPMGAHPEPVVMRAEQSNTSVVYDGYVILKLYRRVEQGMNPDLEIGRVLTRMRFPYVPSIAGALEYQHNSGSLVTLGVLQQFVVNDGNAWQYSLEAVKRFFDRVLREHLPGERPMLNTTRLLDLAREDYSSLARHLIGEYLESAERLGQRTARLHLALSQVVDDPAFAPEPLTLEYRQSQYQSMMRNMAGTLALLKERMELLSTAGQANARLLFEITPALERIFDAFRDIVTLVPRIRCHGDYHLGQVLCTGADFMIIDFEGEPARSLAERRMKHPSLVDIAGMVRSFHYVPSAFLKEQRVEHSLWASFWSDWTSVAFLKGYGGAATGSEFWPQNPEDVRLLLDVFLVEKALYELRYELNNRPDWVDIPLYGLVELVKTREKSTV
jgi:trehalose synthase-fused probable maltokinase